MLLRGQSSLRESRLTLGEHFAKSSIQTINLLMQKSFNRIALSILILLGWLSSLNMPLAQAASYDIYMTDSGFSPDYLEVTVGDRVYWWNADDFFFDDHSTHSYSYPWNSGPVS